METKSPLHSKTILLNALIALAGVVGSFGIIPSVQTFLQNNSSVIIGVIGVVGIALRMITQGKVTIFDQD